MLNLVSRSLFSRSALRCVALIFLGSAGVAQGSVITTNFAGLDLATTKFLTGYSYAPPDSDGAIGINNFVEFINGGFAVYDRTGTPVAPVISDTQFWQNAGASPTLVNQHVADTRIIYDPLSQRWFATENTLGGSSFVNNSVLIAVSATSDPLGAWSSTSLAAPANTFGDFPTLNVDANAIYIGTNNFTSTGSFAGVTLSSIPKSSLLAVTPTITDVSTFTQTTFSPAIGYTPQAPTNFGTGYTGSTIVSVSATAFNQAQVTPINNTGGAGATLGTSSTVAITDPASASPARQPNGTRTIDTLDYHFSGPIYQVGNLIYAVETIKNPTQDTAAVHWMVFDATTGTLHQEGLITDGLRDLYMPSIAVNANGDVVIGYNESGLDLNISSYVAVGNTVANILSFGEQLLLATSPVNNYTDGFSSTSPDRWGDYSMTMVDPLDPAVFWTIQELAVGSTTWGTQISAIQISAADGGGGGGGQGGNTVPEPGTWALMLAGLGLMHAVVRHKKQVVA